MRPADAVDLPGVRRPHDPQQQVIPLGDAARQVVREEIQPLGRPAPHLHRPNTVKADITHGRLLKTFRVTGRRPASYTADGELALRSA